MILSSVGSDLLKPSHGFVIAIWLYLNPNGSESIGQLLKAIAAFARSKSFISCMTPEVFKI